MKRLSNSEIFQIYRSSHCICEAKKWENSAFCDGCFEDLSVETQAALGKKFRHGFEVAFRRAVCELAGEGDEIIYFEGAI